MAAIGDVDEANSLIGVAVATLQSGTLADALRRIQNDLFDLGADLATPGEDFAPSDMVLRVTATQVARLEAEIDAINAALQPLSSFILPGGTSGAAALHVARATTRRAERSAVGAMHMTPLNPHAISYLNRLSDFLFVAARLANMPGIMGGSGDLLWVPGASR